jgi:pimeloyl-ACP methyl ester carboxylesterase
VNGTVPFVRTPEPSALLSAVDRAFRSLPERYLGAPAGFDATWHVRLGDVGRSGEVRCTSHGARVRAGLTRRRPDVTIGTDAATWLALRDGVLSGVEAFSRRRLSARGNLDLAVAFEGLFRLPNGRPPLLRVHDVPVGRMRLSTLTMGAGPDVVLLHGLGATKASFFDTAAALSAAGYRVNAIDLPGFGSSSKGPALYGPAHFARAVLGAMDELGVRRAHLVGNSMGGRVAIELGLREPSRVGALALLCPAVAFVRRDWQPLVRLLRPEVGLLPHSLGRGRIERQFWSLFADRDLVDPTLADVVVDEFERIYGSAGARLAFLASARAIYLEEPFGRHGFYPRLAGLRPPALFVWSSHDKLIPPGFRRHVEQWLPRAEHVVLEDCGHVPQVERPERINGLIRRFFAHADALGHGARSRRTAA